MKTSVLTTTNATSSPAAGSALPLKAAQRPGTISRKSKGELLSIALPANGFASSLASPPQSSGPVSPQMQRSTERERSASSASTASLASSYQAQQNQYHRTQQAAIGSSRQQQQQQQQQQPTSYRQLRSGGPLTPGSESIMSASQSSIGFGDRQGQATPSHAGTTRSSHPSANFYRATLAEIHQVLYSGSSVEREDIIETVERCYETAAVFENPLTRAEGKQSIADQFQLLALLPGTVWSELNDVCERESFDGNRVLLLSHTLNLALLPSMHEALNGNYGVRYANPSYPPTPWSSMTPATRTPAPGTPIRASFAEFRSPEHEEAPMAARPWPIRAAVSLFHPKRIVSALTSVQLKVVTRLEFNEAGRITFHEDTWGIKEAIEGLIPVIGSVYYFERKLAGVLSSGLSRVLFRTRPLEEDTASQYEEDQLRAAEHFANTVNGGLRYSDKNSPLHSRKTSLSANGGLFDVRARQSGSRTNLYGLGVNRSEGISPGSDGEA
ncbi:uncharacterized protein L969DRAFT_96993 [Mixia osmundae IAM 14324]|uniref:Uncharacterized protein n=1 Tax=Mixia osmundae (strain CBS 9802 / IAM 14324 / JCM 22182 / KY 12970) TaxID=764103 RepID=G7E2Q2_MIXOS|nr:uncharacterized protein L969DRAFT_96993 [Mixia osmundae IAM 14324]KEI36977.1 hypothetical protein L969DRAFT_96993 [Mixia osmundae IAM 14324]GAA97112.1 hypothetical protein E5Q_03787 [Mixia osmundae IAM 14324]